MESPWRLDYCGHRMKRPEWGPHLGSDYRMYAESIVRPTKDGATDLT